MINKVISFESYKVDRSKYEFAVKSILLHDAEGKQRLYYGIVLIDKRSKDIVFFTGLEKYVVHLNRELVEESTYRNKMSRVKTFLNFIMHNTTIKSINEITINEIGVFLESIKTKEAGEVVKGDTWFRYCVDIKKFLINYYDNHNDKIDFGYDSAQLKASKTFSVKIPDENDNERRKRTIMYGHLEVLLYVAKMYNPMLYLAISLMAYAGLREGEVVNLSFSDICEERILGVLKKVEINLSHSDKFRKGKTRTGAIKKLRKQRVYTDFLNEVADAIEFHRDFLTAHNLPQKGNDPIFYNKDGGAMSVTTLLSDIKSLFMNHFLRILEQTSINMEFEGETYAFIETYEDEYPGAHMLRHWFTMYLIAKKNLRPELVRKWRGDSPNSDAYNVYVNLNEDLIEAYKNTVYFFQESLLGDIYDEI